MLTDYISLCQMTTSSGISDHSEKTKKQEPLPSNRSSRVLIVGAGLEGLFLAILLERLGIPFYLFERATRIKPLGKRQAEKKNKEKKKTEPSSSIFTFLG